MSIYGKKFTRELEEASKVLAGLNFASTDDTNSKPTTKSQMKNAKRRQKNKSNSKNETVRGTNWAEKETNETSSSHLLNPGLITLNNQLRMSL